MRDTCRVGQQGVHARRRRAMARAILPTRNKPCAAPLPTVRHRRVEAAQRRVAQGRQPVARDEQLEGQVDGPLDGEDDRDAEMAEQASKVVYIPLDLGPKTLVRLRYEQLLDVYDRSPATVGDNAFNHRRVVACSWRQSRSSTAKPFCTTEDISEYVRLNGANIE